jgi:hypothetical protein
MWRLQKSQLHNDKKQKEAFRPAGDQEVLQFVPQAHSTQGSEVASLLSLEGQGRFCF